MHVYLGYRKSAVIRIALRADKFHVLKCVKIAKRDPYNGRLPVSQVHVHVHTYSLHYSGLFLPRDAAEKLLLYKYLYYTYKGRVPVSRVHVQVADYFCQGMQLKNFGHFYRAPAFKNAISVLMFGTRLFSALAD